MHKTCAAAANMTLLNEGKRLSKWEYKPTGTGRVM